MKGVRYKFASGRITHVVFDTKLYRGLLTDFLDPILGYTIELNEVEKWEKLNTEMKEAERLLNEKYLTQKTELSFFEKREIRDQIKGVRRKYSESAPVYRKFKNPKLDMKSIEYITDLHGRPTGVALSLKYYKTRIKDHLELIEFALSKGKDPNKWLAKREAVHEQVKQLEKRMTDRKAQLTYDEEIRAAKMVARKGMKKVIEEMTSKKPTESYRPKRS